MTQHNLNLTALLGARLCHDMISPVGAINNGVELLTLAGDESGALTELVADSAANASARLQLFRIAFGPVSDHLMSGDELAGITSAYFGEGRFHVDWPSDVAFTRAQAQMMLLICLVLESATLRRCRLSVQSPTRLVAQSERDLGNSKMWGILCEGGDWPATLAPAEVHFPLAAQAMHDAGLVIKSGFNGQAFEIELTPALTLDAVTTAPFRRLRQGI